MSPSSIVSHRHSVLNESEYPCSSIPSHLEDKIQQRPIQNSRSNSKLKGIQKQTRGDKAKKQEGKRSILCYDKAYSKDYPNSFIDHIEDMKAHLDIPNYSKDMILKKHKGKKRIRFTDQCNLYTENECDMSWFNTGQENQNPEDYGIKIVEDINNCFVNGDFIMNEESQATENFLDTPLDLIQNQQQKEFNEVKYLKQNFKF